MKETLQTIADRLGISMTTVSRVLSGNADKYRISDKTRDIVMDEALRCHYTPSAVARSLRMQRTNMIGLILPSMSNKYFADIAAVVISECREMGYTTIVMDVAENEEFQKDSVRSLAARKVDGMIIAPCGSDPTQLEMIDREHFPVVLIDRYFEQSRLSYVTTNNYQGGVTAVKHLIENGHSNIACIQGVQTSLPNRKRVEGYISAMKNASLENYIQVIGNDFSVQNGYVETRLLLSSRTRPTAIFALSNTIALGVLRALRESGLRIPEDISLVSFDDNIYMDYMEPPVTRVIQPVEDMAKLSVRFLLNAIKARQESLSSNGASQQTSGQSELQLAPRLIRRDSVCMVSDNFPQKP
ncbi:MAG: LacI family DNA-binding transcriptional regulator [Candidatus Cryptobacteroides sp.]